MTYNNVPVVGSPFRPEYTGAQVTVRGIPENAKVGKTYAFSGRITFILKVLYKIILVGIEQVKCMISELCLLT